VTPWSLPSWFSVFVLSGLAVFLWVRRPPAALWPSVLLCNLLSLCWVLGDLATSFTTEFWQEELAVSLLYTGSIGTVISWWVVAVAYVRWQGLGYRWLDGPWARVPIGLGAVVWLMMISNHWHGEFVIPVVGARNIAGWGIGVTAAVCYPLVAGTSILFFALSREHASRSHRQNARILGVATLLPLSTSAAYAFGPWQVPLDFAAVGLGAGGIAVGYGIFRNRLFRLLPVALPEVLRHDPTAVLLTDTDGRLMFWNPALTRLFPGLALAHDLEVYPALARWLRHPGDEKPINDAEGLERALRARDQPESGHLFQLEEHTHKSAEDDPWLRVSVTSIPARCGETVALALRFVDITAQRRGELQRRALEAQIQHVEKLRSLGVLAGGIASDFNDRLTVILGNASLALQDLSPGDAIHESVEEIEAVARNAAELTQQLLAYSGRSQSAHQPVDFSELVRNMVPQLEAAVSPKVSLKPDLADGLPSIEADPIQFRQVLQNLVANANEAMGSHSGEIVLRTAKVQTARPRHRDPYGQKVAPGPHVLLEVSDNGCGMDEGVRRRV
jgi:signal transduction histidine kinase